MKLSALIVVATVSSLVNLINASWSCDGLSNNKKDSCEAFSACIDAFGFSNWNTSVQDSFCSTVDGNPCKTDSSKFSCNLGGVSIGVLCNKYDRITEFIFAGESLNEYIIFDETQFATCLDYFGSAKASSAVFSVPDVTSNVVSFEEVCKEECNEAGCEFNADLVEDAASTFDLDVSDFVVDGTFSEFSECSTALATDAPTESPTDSPTATPTTGAPTVPTESPTDSPTAAPTTGAPTMSTASPTSSPTELSTPAPTFGSTIPDGSTTIAPTSARPDDNSTDAPTLAETDAPTFSPTRSPSSSSSILSTSIVLVVTAAIASFRL